MATAKLGQLEEVDLRAIWGDESRDFTPWLAEHLDELGAALGLDLNLIEQEAGVGPFAVDILAEEDEAFVVIENQLERTDHGHLGQLLTYAAGRDARTLIWITPNFRDEHRAALDWLNRWTAEEIRVFGVAVRAVRIGDSLPAPEFRAVAFPNNWSRRSAIRSNRSQSAAAERYREFFLPVVTDLHERGHTNRTEPTGKNAQYFNSGRSQRIGSYSTVLRDGSGSARVLAWLTPDNDRAVFDLLHRERSEIESELGAELVWERLAGHKWSTVSLRCPFDWSMSDDDLEEIQQWMIGWIPKFKRVLEPRLNRIAEELEREQLEGVSSGLDGDSSD